MNEKNISVEIKMGNEKIMADEDNFQQIIFNLIHNAVKNTGENGKIVITSGIYGKEFIWIEVVDSGPEIPESAREDIFKPYFTLDSSGTGLGLAIVKQLAFKHGWDISYTDDTSAGGAGFRIKGVKRI
jgi:two-component system osmolarity sensor histidine kinase EnvZ